MICRQCNRELKEDVVLKYFVKEALYVLESLELCYVCAKRVPGVDLHLYRIENEEEGTQGA